VKNEHSDVVADRGRRRIFCKCFSSFSCSWLLPNFVSCGPPSSYHETVGNPSKTSALQFIHFNSFRPYFIRGSFISSFIMSFLPARTDYYMPASLSSSSSSSYRTYCTYHPSIVNRIRIRIRIIMSPASSSPLASSH